MDSKCRACGAEVVWVQAGTQRIPLDARVPVYRILSTGGTPTAEKASTTLGMPFVAMVDHRRVCWAAKSSPAAAAGRAVDRTEEE